MTLFTVLIIVLFFTAIVDLIVGVSNDAVNFLNSAIGSRVASVRNILIVASFGILLGATFSSGMMEIARNGLFNPSYFNFREVIYIFLAVMLTDIILLDIYNDFGLPTSTTVSLVFELLGAAFAAGMLTSMANGISLDVIPLKDFINFSSAITIVTGIFLSIFLAFFFGTVIQHLSRIAFTFSLTDSVRKYGALFSGLTVTIIIYYLLIKGAKGSSFITDDQVAWVMENTWTINMISFVAWSIIIQILMWWKDFNPLKFVVLLGTFALAMAFAGNDLVNFIGVAVGGYLAFQSWSASGVSPDSYNMSILSEKFQTPSWILLLAGVIMIVTLWTNAKSRKVTETEVSLGRQEEGDEKFKSNWLSRLLVGASLWIGRLVESMVPKKLTKALEKRFIKQISTDKEKDKEKDKDAPSFDLLRAAVNLLVSSVLIAYGTSQKLPLSTTFVTFMVAMGSSLADQAWGRESAVYRVAGVMNVIAGWLITAVIAFCSSALLAFVLYKTGAPGVFVLVGLAAFLLARSHVMFSRKQKKEIIDSQEFSSKSASSPQVVDESKPSTVRNLKLAVRVYTTCTEALTTEEPNAIAKSLEKIQELHLVNLKGQQKIIKHVRKIPQQNLGASRLYILLFDYMQDLYQSIQLISESCIEHLKNFHSKPSPEFLKASYEIEKNLAAYTNRVCQGIETTTFKDHEKTTERFAALTTQLNQAIDQSIAEIQREAIGNRIGMLQIKLLLETNDVLTTIHKIYSLYYDYHRLIE
jgi:phosphate/sulfate permease